MGKIYLNQIKWLLDLHYLRHSTVTTNAHMLQMSSLKKFFWI